MDTTQETSDQNQDSASATTTQITLLDILHLAYSKFKLLEVLQEDWETEKDSLPSNAVLELSSYYMTSTPALQSLSDFIYTNKPIASFEPSILAPNTFDLTLLLPEEAFWGFTPEQISSVIGPVNKQAYYLDDLIATWVRDKIEDMGKPYPRVQIQAYSAAAGVAQLTAARLALLGIEVAVMLWGAPRVLSVEAANVYSRLVPNTLNIANSCDEVTFGGTLPVMQDGSITYQHVGYARTLNFNLGDSTKNHSLEGYMAALEKELTTGG